MRKIGRRDRKKEKISLRKEEIKGEQNKTTDRESKYRKGRETARNKGGKSRE